jgi:hypothetical protein
VQAVDGAAPSVTGMKSFTMNGMPLWVSIGRPKFRP